MLLSPPLGKGRNSIPKVTGKGRKGQKGWWEEAGREEEEAGRWQVEAGRVGVRDSGR